MPGTGRAESLGYFEYGLIFCIICIILYNYSKEILNKERLKCIELKVGGLSGLP
jgi:hypothetical protein